MADRDMKHLGRITTEPAPEETGADAGKTKAAEKAVAMGKVEKPEDAARASAADAHRDRGGVPEE
ncbi:hypothetical protein [Arenibaculum sp.]|jgi:hypothetical protein|uniref:hypothetical protein n=1 Tax=Arenibaculum sp. TaxID=2865862 RepID=UPI002E13FBC0|nr:hypothetical protein [Arenibaculum sp.]